MTPTTVVLVEGASDRAAVLALAARLERDLAADGIAVLSMGGVTNTRAFALWHGPAGLGLRLTGLFDAPEAGVVRRGLELAGVPLDPGGEGLAALGFFGCVDDLEDELIRALGVAAVEAVIAGEDETASLDLLAQMPAQREWSREQVLHRFFGSQSGRKARYARLLVEALAPDRVPRPMQDLMATL